jgi:hypothetical protein
MLVAAVSLAFIQFLLFRHWSHSARYSVTRAFFM